VGFTNLVGCIPRDDGGLAKAADGPDDDQVGACTPRLQEIVRIADPALLVLVGKQSQEWITPGYKHSIRFHKSIKTVGIIHPAAIMRQNVANQSVAWQRCVVQVATALEDLRPPEPPKTLIDRDDIPF
jgi:uracil-DNA glycosylase